MTLTQPTTDADAAADLPELTHFVAGVRTAAASGTHVSPVFNPATGRPIATVHYGTAADVDHAVAAARTAFATWRRTTPKDRADVLLACAAVIEQHSEELAPWSFGIGALMTNLAQRGLLGRTSA